MIPHLIEPYIFGAKPKEKHWMEQAEEEHLFYQYLMEANKNNNVVQHNNTTTTVAHAPAPAAPAAGWVNQGYFNPPLSTLGFTVSPSVTGSAPYTVSFTQTSHPDVVKFCTFEWNFGDGSTKDTLSSTSHVFQTGSFIVNITASSQFNGTKNYASQRITSSLPVYVASFTQSRATGSIPVTVNFTNLTFINQYTGSFSGVTYKWTFGSGSVTSSLANPTVIYFNTGSYTVKLEATGSYGMTSSTTKFAVSAST